ncbi:hypothetical protein LUZ60_003000 [Juncus effusus]|nr:hypothetical protein LUZ60_003000 [Juncus effusus]
MRRYYTLFSLILLSSLTPTTLSKTTAIPPPSPDAGALLAFKSAADPSDQLLFSPASPTPCKWAGVSCSPTGTRITRLVLESLNLNGTFAESTLGKLDQLRILSLKFNFLTGTVPDLSNLINLKALFLDHNLFSGPFPVSILSLHRLRTLDLSHNAFAGSVPVGLTGLDRLAALNLDSNGFTGTVPPLNQSSLKSFNVSNNNLTGPVPATPVLSSFGTKVFLNNPGLCGEAVRKECKSRIIFFPNGSTNGTAVPAPAVPPSTKEGFLLSESSPALKSVHKKTVLAIVLASSAILILVIFTLLIIVRKNRRDKITAHEKIVTPEKSTSSTDQIVLNHSISQQETVPIMTEEIFTEEKAKTLGKSGCLTFFAGEMPGYNLEQLMKASAEMLGRGNLGATYKAVLEGKTVVCVKRLDGYKIGGFGREVFERHMEAVGRLRHVNLVSLRAYFHAKEERLLVFDYMPNGSLLSLIHGSKSSRAKPLHWTSCLKIAEDVMRGLSYIHQASRLVHGNIKSSNVLLGADFEACLTDNCLSFLLDEQYFEQDGEVNSYRAPEAKTSFKNLTPRSDIYAFGVLLLELLSGKPPLDHQELVSKDLPEWVRAVRAEGEGADDERLMMIADIAASCVRSAPDSRPTAWQVLKMIQEVKDAETMEDEEEEDGSGLSNGDS